MSQALNAGVQAARGTWVQFLNGGDTYADAGSLGAMVERADARVAMVCAFARVLQRDFTIPRRALRPGRDGFLYISHQATLFRRALFDAHGLFEPGVRIHMDLEWLARLPQDLPYAFLARETIHFDPHGVSATQVVEASMEEVRILWRRPATRARVPLVLLLLLPFRVLRRELRKWSGS
ncbi:glycosyltransferase [Piscinibacter sakaiensis]|uniref:glycosyltransferase n=1 Tax=Piscinibacter sakaiensis TaxID=1547922 RepID=UPI00372C8842